MTSLLEDLCQDHANFGRILNIIEAQATAVAEGAAPDFDILSKAVEYLSGYPAFHHHPLENAICERLKRVRPAVTAAVDGIMGEHAQVGERLAVFRKFLADSMAGRGASREALAKAALDFVNAEWLHMERERSELFPAAVAVLGPEDWKLLAERADPRADPLFGTADAPQLARLHGLLAACDAFSQSSRERQMNATA